MTSPSISGVRSNGPSTRHGSPDTARIASVSTRPVVSLTEKAPASRRRQWPIAVAGLVLVLAYLVGAVVQGFLVNVDTNRTDQSAYMDYARKMATDPSHVGDRARMPVYPFLQSLLYRPGMSDDEFFRRGKAFNIGLSVVLLFLTYLLLSKWLDPAAATAIVLVTAFTVFVFKAGHFQCELLFYFLNLLFFVLCIESLRRPTVARAAFLGLVAGVAYLTKASVLPGIVLFLVCYIWSAIARRRKQARQGDSLWWSAGRAAVFVLVFLAVVYPYIRTSKQVFGRYFYNVTTTFYFWYDSWEEVERGTKAHGDRVGWPRMTPEDLPSARRYWKEHTLKQLAGRLGGGIVTVFKVSNSSYGYLKYAAIYLIFAVLFTYQHAARAREILFRGTAGFATAFVIAYFTVYLLLYAWYTPIADGNRLTLSLFLPGLAAIGYYLARVAGEPWVRVVDLRLPPAGLHRFVIALVCLDVVFSLPGTITALSGAD